jgi:hypothetical protein
MAFIRNTLRYKLPGEDYRCDIVMGVPAGFDQCRPPSPTTGRRTCWCIRRARAWTACATPTGLLALPQQKLKSLRIGIYDRTPASDWLAKHALVDQAVPYHMLNADPDQYPGQLVERDLAGGRIDVAIVWGPIGGYFAKRVRTPELRVVPMRPETGVKFDYAMAMGVRHGEAQWKQQIEALIDKRRAEILAILREYGVPLLEDAPPPAAGR